MDSRAEARRTGCDALGEDLAAFSMRKEGWTVEARMRVNGCALRKTGRRCSTRPGDRRMPMQQEQQRDTGEPKDGDTVQLLRERPQPASVVHGRNGAWLLTPQ